MPGPETKAEPTFGQVAVRHGFAAAAQVNECILVQNEERKAGKDPRHVGQIMIERGYLTQEKVQEVLRLMSQERSVPALQITGYQILSKLGQGGMGAVYKAKQVSMDRLVALKLLPARLAQNKSYIDRFYQEARAAGRLNHENIVRAYDVGESSGLHFFSMEFIEGENVQSLLRKQKQLDEKLVLDIALQIARALDHAHKHTLVHRDIKPENIMITVDGVAKLCDLGLAKDTSGDSSLTQVGTCVGTPHYIAPEQARGEQDIDIRADIYSLGASMFHMLIGEPVFNGPSPAVVMTKHLTEPVPPPNSLRAEVTQPTSSIILKCMAKEREARYQSPLEMIADIEAAIGGGEVTGPTLIKAPPKTGGTRRMKDTRHERAVVAPILRSQPPPPSGSPMGMIAGIAAVAVIGVVVLILAGKNKEGPPPAPNPPPKVGVEPGPVNPVPPVVAGPTQAEEDKAKQGLEVVEETRTRIGKDPKHFVEVVQLYEEFIENKDFKFTKWALEARKRLDGYKKEIEAEASKLLEPIEKKAEGLAAEEKFLDAANAFAEFPVEVAFTEAGGRAAQARDGYLRRAHDKVDGDLRRAEQLGSDRKYDEAKALLEAAKPLCDAAQLVQVNELLGKIEQARTAYESERLARATEIYDDLRKRAHKALRDRKFDDARAELEKGKKDPALSARAEEIGHDLEEVGLLEAVYDDALKGAKKLAGAKQPITLAQFGQSVTPSMEGDEVVFRVGGATMPLSFSMLKRSDVVALAGKVLDGAQGETHFKYGLVYFFGIDPENPPKEKDETLAKARTELDTARKKDPRAERYYRWLDDLANASQIGAAKKLYDEAKQSYAAQRWTEAQNRLVLLLKTYGELSFVRDRKGEIDGMLAAISAKLDADKKAFDGIFAVPPKSITKEGKIDITYDFSDPAQGKDWEAFAMQVGPQPPGGDWAIVKGEAMGRGHKYYYWRPRLVGDFSVEFLLTSDENRNLGVQFCDDRAGKFYRATLGYELQDRWLTPVLMPKSTSLVRIDIGVVLEVMAAGDRQKGQQRLRDEGHVTLDGGSDPKLASGKKYRVQVNRIQDSMEFWVNGASVAKAKDGAYKEGHIALWCDSDPANPKDVCGSWDNVHIVGHLDPEWLRQATGK
ncbi:MAG: protein kinase [Planctomycetota bacterium]